MRAVLISIRPNWCEKIINGDKTIEVRKTRPKLDTPFKCYIYRTKGTVPHIINGEWVRMEVGGTVIGEFTCDRIYRTVRAGFGSDNSPPQYYVCLDSWRNVSADWLLSEAQLNREKLETYLAGGDGYGWHITDLRIYDAPRELREFWFPPERYCEKGLCGGCPCDQIADVNGEYEFDCEWRHPLSRPPQSWCYVEET